jgi:hypothetical protein
MKKFPFPFIAILIFTIISTGSVQAQNWPGPVGIGTSNPQIRLHVVDVNGLAASWDDALSGFVQLWGDNSIMWKNGNQNGGLRFGSATNLTAGGYDEKMRIMDNWLCRYRGIEPGSQTACSGKWFF